MAFEEEDETLESELADQLLEITSEEELDQFLGKLARSVVRGAKSFVRSPIGRALGGALKSVAKKALPIVGGAIGSFVAPGLGTAIGSKLGSLAGGLLEAEEAEAMGEEEAQQEAARRYVRFARAAYRNAARTPRSVPPKPAARAAFTSAARLYAPSLLGSRRPARRPNPPGATWGAPYAGAVSYAGPGWNQQPDQTWGGSGDDGSSAPPDEGRWVRRGGKVILLGL